MYSTEHQCGVLGDYDLAILLGRLRARGTDRTGTVTFMAIHLLNKKYWDGLIKRQYHHELEAFVWVLPFVFLRYQDRAAVPNTIVEEWMTSDYATCHEKKSSFLFNLRQHHDSVQPDFKKVWQIARKLLSWVALGLLEPDHRQAQQLEDEDDEKEVEGVDTLMDTPEELEVPALVTRASFVQILMGMRGLEYLNDVLTSLRVPTSA